jgi:hypothetical protein
MDALTELERRFRIKIPRKPEGPTIVDPVDRGSSYVSDKWHDVPRVLALLEQKLLRIRDKCAMVDYVKFCRVIDAIRYDFDKTEKVTPDMVAVLRRAGSMMDDVAAILDNVGLLEVDGNDLPA